MKILLGFGLSLLLLQGCRNPTGDLAPQNPLLTPATPTPVACVPGPLSWDDFSSAAVLNTGVTWGDFGNGATITGTMETTISNGTPNSWHLTAKAGTGWGCGMNILATSNAVLNAFCKTTFKYDVRCTAAAVYTIRFKELGATGGDSENWVSPVQTATAGAFFTTVAIPIASFTEDPYGDAVCSGPGACATPAYGNSTVDLGAIKRVEIGFTAPNATFDIYIDNIRFE